MVQLEEGAGLGLKKKVKRMNQKSESYCLAL